MALVAAAVSSAPVALAAPAAAQGPIAKTPAVTWSPPSSANTTPTGAVPTAAWSPTVTPTSQPKSGQAAAQSSTSATSSTVSPQAVPAGTTVGTPGLGLLPSFATEAFPLSAKVTATVNVANGNLVLRSTDDAVTAPGLSLQLDRFYNGLSSGTGAFGKASVLSTGRDVGLAGTTGTGTVTFSGPSGFTAAFTPTSGGSYTAPAGINADLIKNANGTFTLTYRRTGEKLSFSTGGFLTSDVDRNSVGLSLLYDGSNQLSSITDAAGRVTTVIYTAGRISQISDSAGRATAYGYDSNANLATVTDPAGGLTRYNYDTTGRVSAIQTVGGNWTSFGYDSASRITSINRYTTKGASSGDAATTTFAYPSTTSTTETNPLGKTSTFTLDSAGRVTKTTDALSHSRSTTYTANSDVATAVDAMGVGSTAGNTTTYTYDSNNSLSAVAIPTGAATNLAYVNGSGCSSTDTTHPYQPKCSTDAQGKTQTATYDTPGNVTKVQDTTGGTAGVSTSRTYQRPAGATTGTTCGAKPGQVCSETTGTGSVVSYDYDASGNVTTVHTLGSLDDVTYTYDSLSRVTSKTTGTAGKVTYSYDVRDRYTQTGFADGDAITYSFDADGNKTQTSTSTESFPVTYDALNRQLTQAVPGPDNGTLLTTSYDKAGNVLTYADRDGTTTYTYDAANELTAVAEPGGSCPTTGTGTKCTRFGYNANGARTTTTYPGGVVQTATVDPSGRTTRILAQKPSSPVISDLSYSYTGTGTGTAADRSLLQKKTTTVSIAGAPNGAVTTYGYDSYSRLLNATEKTGGGATNAAWVYTYDADGNRTSQNATNPDGTTETTTAGYNEANELTTINGATAGITYDGDGNQTFFPDINPSPLRASAPSRSVGYSTDVAVTTSTNGGASVNSTYLGADQNIRTLYGNNLTFQTGPLGLTSQKTGTTITDFTRDNDGNLVAIRTGATSSYYLTDNQGSVIGLVDNTGTKIAAYAYDPYGATRTITGTTAGDLTAANNNPNRYTSGYRDNDTGLYKLGYRYYDTIQGRFTQQDPSGQETNLFSYAGASPVNATDPDGLYCIFGTYGGPGGACRGGGVANSLAGASRSGVNYGATGCIIATVGTGPEGCAPALLGGYVGGFFYYYVSK